MWNNSTSHLFSLSKSVNQDSGDENQTGHTALFWFLLHMRREAFYLFHTTTALFRAHVGCCSGHAQDSTGNEGGVWRILTASIPLVKTHGEKKKKRRKIKKQLGLKLLNANVKYWSLSFFFYRLLEILSLKLLI